MYQMIYLGKKYHEYTLLNAYSDITKVQNTLLKHDTLSQQF